MFPRTDQNRGLRFLLQIQRVAAAFLFGAYGVWNLYWLAQGTIPPSIFLKLTGWPGPTTGGTRAIIQLWHGNWQESLRYHAMAIPIILLFLVSASWLLGQAATRSRLNLPLPIFWSWVTFLAVAWVLKLTGDPMYW